MIEKADRWARRKVKHRNDYDHVKGGRCGGNARYNGRRCNNTGNYLEFRTVDQRFASYVVGRDTTPDPAPARASIPGAVRLLMIANMMMS
jgi:hypothetical protein